MGLTLGVDIGTSSCKGVLVAADGTLRGPGLRPHPVSSPAPGLGRARRRADLVGRLPRSGRRTAAAPTAPSRVAAADRRGRGQRHRAVPAARRRRWPAAAPGDPVRRRHPRHRADRRADRAVRRRHRAGALRLAADQPGHRAEARPGWPSTSRRSAAATRRWFMASSYLAFRLTGEYVLDHHSASQSVPLYSPRTNAWIERVVRTDRPGPGVAAPGVAGRGRRRRHAQAAAETGLPEGIPVMAGTIDAWAEAVSVGVLQPGDVMLMYGTTMFLVHVTRQAYALAEPVGHRRRAARAPTTWPPAWRPPARSPTGCAS